MGENHAAQLMAADLLQGLPLEQRLALSYASRAARDDTLTLLALDARLAGILRGRGEILVTQLKLAWWRDRFAQSPADWPAGEPLLARLAAWGEAARGFSALVDGWEALLAEQLGRAEISEFANGRAASWAMLAQRLGAGGAVSRVEQAAGEWALADLSLHLGDSDDAQLARKVTLEQGWQATPLPRVVRPLRVLHGLAERSLRRGGELLDGPGAALLAMRIGLTGR